MNKITPKEVAAYGADFAIDVLDNLNAKDFAALLLDQFSEEFCFDRDLKSIEIINSFDIRARMQIVKGLRDLADQIQVEAK